MLKGESPFHYATKTYLSKNPYLLLPQILGALGGATITNVQTEYTITDASGQPTSSTDILIQVSTQEGDEYDIPIEVKSSQSINHKTRRHVEKAGRDGIRKFTRAVYHGNDPNLKLSNMPFGLMIIGTPENHTILPYDMDAYTAILEGIFFPKSDIPTQREIAIHYLNNPGRLWNIISEQLPEGEYILDTEIRTDHIIQHPPPFETYPALNISLLAASNVSVNGNGRYRRNVVPIEIRQNPDSEYAKQTGRRKLQRFTSMVNLSRDPIIQPGDVSTGLLIRGPPGYIGSSIDVVPLSQSY